MGPQPSTQDTLTKRIQAGQATIEGLPCVLQGLQEMIAVVIDRPDLAIGEHLGEGMFQDVAVLQNVGDARGAAEIVLEHAELAVGVPHQVGTGHMGPDASRRPQALALLAVEAGTQHQLLGDHAIGEDPLARVDVGDEAVQGMNALLEARLDGSLLLGTHDPWDDVEGEDALRSLALAVYGEGDPHGVQRRFSGAATPADLLGR